MKVALGTAASQGVHTYLALVFRTPEEAVGGWVLFCDMTQEVHVLYDPQGFLENPLAQLRGKLQALGAKRIPVATGNLWV